MKNERFPKIILDDGTEFLTDFRWINVQVKTRNAWRKEAETRAAQHGMSLCCLRMGRKYKAPFQYGLHPAPEKKPKKALPLSLALAICNQTPGSFLGLFAIGGMFWLFAIRNGQILLDGDQTFDDRGLAQDALHKIQKNFEWGANDILDLSENPQESIERLRYYLDGVYGGRKTYVDFNEKPNYTVFILLFLLLAMGCGAAWWFKDILFREETRPPASPHVLFPREWERSPSVWQQWTTCEKAMEQTDIFDHMWVVKTAICKPGKFDVTYRRSKGGSYLYIPEGSKIVKPEKPDEAAASKKTDKLKPRGKENVSGYDALAMRLREFFRPLQENGVMKVKFNTPPVERRADGEPPVQVTSPWRRIELEIVTKSFPNEVMGYISGIPGAILKKVDYKYADHAFTWTFTVTVFTDAKAR